MKNLKSLISLLSSQDISFFERWEADPSIGYKTLKLVSNISNGLYKSDTDAIDDLYQETNNNTSYRKLKSRLKGKLINEILLLDFESKKPTPYQKNLHKSLKTYASAKILLDIGLRNNSIELMEVLLRASLKYDNTEMSLMILKDLKMHYGLYLHNKNKYEKYSKLYNETKAIYNYRETAEHLYTELGFLLQSKKSTIYNKEIELLEVKSKKLNKKIKNLDSYYLKFYAYNASYFLSMIKKDFHSQYEISEKAINYFSLKNNFKKTATFSFLQKKGIALLALKKTKEAYSIFLSCLKFRLKEGGLAWQSIHNYLFICNVLRNDYDQCYEIISKVMNHENFDRILPMYRQHWYIKEAFMFILLKNGRVNLNSVNNKLLRQFRINRFLNEIPELSKDSKGYNITIHIIHMLFLIIEDKYDQALNKILSLKQYSYRHLRSQEYDRANCFIKMLLKIPACNYDLSPIIKKTRYLQQKLLSTPLDFSEQAMSIEIIPYEQLWEEVLELL